MNERKSKAELRRLRSIAEDYYIRMNKTQKEIAGLIGVTEQTIGIWKKGDPGEKTWDERKRDAEMTPGKLRELILNEAHKVVKGERSDVNADQLSKFMAALDRVDKQVNPHTAMSLFMMFDEWLNKIDHDKAVEVTKLHMEFMKHLVELATK